MKKIIIAALGCFIVAGIANAVYLYTQRIALNKTLILILKQEITKQYPEIGYSFTSSLDGALTSHPLLEELTTKKLDAIFDLSEAKKISSILADLKTNNESLVHAIKDQKGNLVELFLLKQNDTLHGLIFFPDELKKFVATEERHILIFFSLSLLIAFCCCILLLSVMFFTRPELWWYSVMLISGAMMINIYYLWSLHHSVGFQENLKTMPILSKSQERYFFQKLHHERNSPIIKSVPTGIFIEHAQFTQQGSDIHPGVFLRGYIWQRYNAKEHAGIDRDFTIANAYMSIKQELSHQTTNDDETICWAFSCNLYETFNAKLYPFDHRHIIINLLHKDFEKNIALSPDLSSYEVINSILLPGVSSKISLLSHWRLIKSYFNFEVQNLNTTLGFPDFSYKQVPYLQFVIDAQRRPAGSFLMHFVLLFVVFTTLFILLMAFLKQETLIDIVGFSTLSVIGACSALLFVLITSEINLRQLLMAEGIVYLESMYFIAYFIIIGVVINSIVFAVRGDLPFFTYHSNLLFKLSYWPTVFLSIVITTAYMFY